MKKHIFASLLALSFCTLGLQEASAWFKFNAGAGANLGWQSGGSKNLMWGLYRSSDTPLVSQYYQGATPAGGPLSGIPMGFGGAPAAPHAFANAGQGFNPQTQFGMQGQNQFNPTMGQFGGMGMSQGQASNPFYNFGATGQDFGAGWMSPVSKAEEDNQTNKPQPSAYQPYAPASSLPIGMYYPYPGYSPFYGYGW